MNLDFFKNKTILITGNTGFKGSWLSEILYLVGANVIGYALKPKEKSLYNILNLEEKITTIYGDIRDIEKVLDTFRKYKPEIVIHMAAQPLVLESIKNPHYTFETNIMGTVNILESMRKNNCVKSFLNVTTDKVYFDSQTIDDKGYVETDRLCGRDPYSNSKSCSELITYSYKNTFFCEDYPRISTARSGNVIGGGDFSENRIIPDCIASALKNENIKIRNPQSIRPYQHVLECLQGYLLIIKKQYEEKCYEGNYNFGPKECMTTENLVKSFCDIWGNNQKYECINENSKVESNYLKLNSSLAIKKLNWKRKWDTKKAIEKTIQWSKTYNQCNEKIIEITDNQIKEYFEVGGQHV